MSFSPMTGIFIRERRGGFGHTDTEETHIEESHVIPEAETGEMYL